MKILCLLLASVVLLPAQSQNASTHTRPFESYPFASLPTTGCNPGEIAYTTDTHAIYQNDATGTCSWATITASSQILCASNSTSGLGSAANMLSADGGTYNTLVSTAAQASAKFYASNCLVPANYLQAGTILRVTATFVYTAAASSPTRLFTLDMCTVSGCATGVDVPIYKTTATAWVASQTNASATWSWLITSTAAAGSAVPLETSYLSSFFPNAGLSENQVVYAVSACSGTTTGCVNTTVDNYLSISLKYGAATAGNMEQLRTLIVEVVKR